jgi:hypothetical protein
MHRVFALDAPTCPRCGGRLRVIATVQDPAVVRAILAHLGLAPGPDSPGPAPARPHRGYRVTLPPGGPTDLSAVCPIDAGAGRPGRRLPRSRGPVGTHN